MRKAIWLLMLLIFAFVFISCENSTGPNIPDRPDPTLMPTPARVSLFGEAPDQPWMQATGGGELQAWGSFRIDFHRVPNAAYHRTWIRHINNPGNVREIIHRGRPGHSSSVISPYSLSGDNINASQWITFQELREHLPGFFLGTVHGSKVNPDTQLLISIASNHNGWQFGISAMCAERPGIMSAITWSRPSFRYREHEWVAP